MKKVTALIRQHPVWAYVLLLFAVSWSGVVLLLGPLPRVAGEAEIGRLMAPVYVVLLAGPTVAGVLLTGVLGGRAGLRELAARCLRWRVGLRWYAVALLVGPLTITVVTLLLALVSRDFLPRIYVSDDRAGLILFSLVSALIVGLFEEPGYTGFATPALRRRYGVLVTGLVVGVLWAGLKIPVVYWEGGDKAGPVPVLLFLCLTLFTWHPAYRVLMTWVYDHTGSLFLAILMNASLISFWTMFTPLTVTGVALLTYYLVLTAALWLAVGAVVLASRGRRARPPLQTRSA